MYKRQFLDRIARAPDLAAYSVVTAERALAQADAADRLLAAGISMGPLHGVPVAVKDSVQSVSYTHLCCRLHVKNERRTIRPDNAKPPRQSSCLLYTSGPTRRG